MQVNNQTNNYHVPYTGGADDIMGLSQWEGEIQHIQVPGQNPQRNPQNGTVLQTRTITTAYPQANSQNSGVQDGAAGAQSGMNGMQSGMPDSVRAGMQQSGMMQSGTQQNSMPQSGTQQNSGTNMPARMGNYMAHEDQPAIEMGDVIGWRQDGTGRWLPVFTGQRAETWQNMLATTPLDMSNPASMEATDSPMTQEEAAMGSLKGLLGRNLGHYVVATFVVGTRNFIVWRGILETVGNDYLVIYQPTQDRHISCDFYALKFIEFHNTRASMNDSQTGMGMEM